MKRCEAQHLLLLNCAAHLLVLFQSVQGRTISLDNQPHQRPSLQSNFAWRTFSPERLVPVSSTHEVADIVQMAYSAQMAGKPVLVRAVQNLFVSQNNFTATAASEPAQSLFLDLSSMNELIDIEGNNVSVQAGMTLQALEDVLHQHQLSLPSVVVTPATAAMGVGAAIATASHGSSLVGPASIAAYLVRAVLVDGAGKVRVLEEPQALLEGSLGLLGIITEVTLEVAPAKKMAVKQLQEEDREMVGDLREIIENSEAVSLDVTWSPSAGLYTARVWHDADASIPGSASNTYMTGTTEALQKVNRRLVKDQQDLSDQGSTMCQVVGDLTTQSHFSGSADNPEADVYGVSVGWLSHMTAARCQEQSTCWWQHAKWTPTELSVNSEDFADWVDDVRAIMSKARGCPSFLFHLRFVMESTCPLAMHSGKQVVAIQIDSYSGQGSAMPAKHQALLDEIVQMMLCKYSARPHWALSTNRMFLSSCPLRDTMAEDWDAFAAQQQRYDPLRVFAPPLFDMIANRRGSLFYPGCAVSGDCFCQEDVHCGPKHKCVAGRVFKEYNVCMAEVWVREGEEL